MQYIIHRINTIEQLRTIPSSYGVEIDIRGFGDRMLLSHDPISDPSIHDDLDAYLSAYDHAFIVFNTKEAGYEHQIIDLAKKHGVQDYFLLDVEFPFLYRATRTEHCRSIAVRYSEAEPIEMVTAQMLDGVPLLDWVWIDTNTHLPLTPAAIETLRPFKTCLVSPDRWGRPEDIAPYIEQMNMLGFQPDAVMTAYEHRDAWEAAYPSSSFS